MTVMRNLKIILIFLIAPGILIAQSPGKVRQELEKTDAVIQRARIVVEPSNNPEAQLLLNQAINIQQAAWDRYQRKRYRQSYIQTLAARQRAREAIFITTDKERIEEEIERTNELINELGPDITGIEDQQTAELWKMAKTEQSAATNYYRAHRWRLALRFTLAARNHLYELMHKIKRFHSREQVQAELERTDFILKQTAEAISASNNNIQAQERLKKAEERQLQAKNHFRSRMPVQAIKLTLAARELAFRSWQQISQYPDSTILNSALKETEHLIAQWSDKINQQENDEFKKMLAAAIEHQNAARELYQQGNLAAALRHANQARQILYRAIELINLAEPIPGRN